MKSGLAQLREEKYRFTVETQGLSYTTKHYNAGARDEDTVWTDDDEDLEEKRKSLPVAQRMATELTKILQEGGGTTDDVLERVLSASLLSNAGSGGYDAAKDYVKQVMGQLFGPDDKQTSAAGPDSPKRASGAPQPLGVGPPTNTSNISKLNSAQQQPCNSGQLVAVSSAPEQLPKAPQQAPGPTIGPPEQAPPPWTALARGSATAATGAVSTAGRHADEEVERPRPRPHHGRIKEQLDLLQNADQLAAIISMATTAATTAATAAVKQSMQAPPPLPPGAFARMHAAGQLLPGLAGFIPAARPPLPPHLTGLGMSSAAAAPAQRNQVASLEDSPDPQPLERRGTLVAPHQRATPMFAARRVEAAGLNATENHLAVSNPSGFQQDSRIESSGMGHAQQEEAAPAVLHPQSQRGLPWALKRLGMPRGLPPVAAEGGEAASRGDLGQHATVAGGSAMGGGNLRVVHLGAPKIIARTPPPVRTAFQRTPALDGEGKPDGVPPGLVGVFQPVLSPNEEFMRAPAQGPRVLGGHMPAGGLGKEESGTRFAAGHTRDTVADASEMPGRHGVFRAGAHAREGHLAAATDGAVVRQGYGHWNQLLEDGAWHHAAAQPMVSSGTARPQLPAAQRLQEGGEGEREVPADGLFITGGESIFTRAGACNAQAGAAVAAAVAQPQPAPRRAALPEDVQHAFRSTLAFIADPDGARPQQPQPLSWAAMADVKDREEAHREAEELLGGPFDYNAIKRELEQAKRSSRLLQPAVGPSLTSAPHGTTTAVATPTLQGGGVAGARIDRTRAMPHTSATSGVPAAAPARAPRGDFVGLLPPPHSVWDIDEAWFDLDEFTKAVEADVAYRAAAPGGTQSRRGSPVTKTRIPSAPATVTLTMRGAGVETSKAKTRRGNSANQAAAPAALAPSSGPAAGSGRAADRKRAASPGATKAIIDAADSSLSPPRPARKAQAIGSFRIAFGRRVEEPPRVHDTADTRARSSSPQADGESPEARVQRRKVKPSAAAGKRPSRGSLPAAGGAASPTSTTDDPVHQVLSALASVLLSGDEEEDNSDDDNGVVRSGIDRDGRDRDNAGQEDDDNRGMVERTEAQLLRSASLTEAATAGLSRPVVSEAGRVVEVPREQPEEPRAGDPVVRPAQQHIASVQIDEPTSTSLASSEAVAAIARLIKEHRAPSAVASAGSDGHVTTAVIPPPRELGVASSATAAAAAPSAPSALAPPWLQPGLQSWPMTTANARPRFEYVVDTAHPPLTRLPAWAASAADAVGGPAAFAAAVGAAPSGLGISTPSRRYPPRSPNGPSTARNVAMSQDGGMEAPGASQGVEDAIRPATKRPYAYAQNLQQPVFAAPGELDKGTQILPPQAAAAAVAARGPVVPAAKGKNRADPIQQLESALLQAVEDEVVSRIAVAQLASLGSAPSPAFEELSGSVSLLVDEELSRRLVCEVLRENLQSLLTAQQQQGRMPATESEVEPTLEDIIAAITTMPAVPSRLQHASARTQTEPQETAQQADVQQQTANDSQGQLEDNGNRIVAPSAEPGRSSSPEAFMPGDSASDGTDAAADAARYGATNTTTGPQHEHTVLDVVGASDPSLHSGLPSSVSLHSFRQRDSTTSTSDGTAHPESLAPLPPPPQSRLPARSPLGPTAEYEAFGTTNAAAGSAVARIAMQTASQSKRTLTISSDLSATQLQHQPGGSEQSPSKSLGIQAHGVQERALQTVYVEARGVQVHAVVGRGVQAVGVQAVGVQARGTQLAGVQERATQAAGVMDSASQADPPLPQYVLQSALVAGLPYGAGPTIPQISALQPVVGPDGKPLAMPRAFYMAPGDLAQQLSSLGLYGNNPGLVLQTYGQSEAKRPPLNLPGLSKMRDSSEVESSSDSMHHHLRGPGARARARAAEALRLADCNSLDSDDGLLQRSYAPLELTSLMARPVRLEQHGSQLTDSTRETRSSVAPAVHQPESMHESARPEAFATRFGAPGVGTAGQDTTRPGTDTRRASTDSTDSEPDSLQPILQSVQARSTSRSERDETVPGVLTQARSSSHSTQSAGSSRTKTSSSTAGTGGHDLDPSPSVPVKPATVNVADTNEGGRSGSRTSSARHSEAGGSAGADGPASGAASRGHTLHPSRQASMDRNPGSVAWHPQEGILDKEGSETGPEDAATLLHALVEQGSGPSSATSKDRVSHVSDPAAAEAKETGNAAGLTGAASPAVSDDEYVAEYFDEDDLDDIQSVHFGSSDDEAVRESLTDLPATAANDAATRREMGQEEEEEEEEGELKGEPASGTLVSATQAAPQMEGVRSGSHASGSDGRGANDNKGAAEEVADFALSDDDEFLDEEEVSRVLDEEDARSQENEAAMPSHAGDSHAGPSGQDAERAATVSRGASLAGSERSLRSGSVRGHADTDRDANSGREDGPQRSLGDGVGRPSDFGPLASGIVALSDEERRRNSTTDRGTGSAGAASRRGSDGYQSNTDLRVSGSSIGLLHSLRSMANPERPAEGIRDDGNRTGSGGGDRGDEITVRSSLDRVAALGLVPLGRPRAQEQYVGSSSGGGSQVQGTNAMPMPEQAHGLQARPVLTPLQLTPLQQSTVVGTSGTAQQLASPGKPPSLADYHGLKGRLWRPPPAQQPHDPLLSSSETLMASSEASGSVLDTLSRALRDVDCRGRVEGPASRVAAALARAQISGLADSLETSALDVSASADSDVVSTIASVYTAAGVTLPRTLMGGAAAPNSAREERGDPRRQQSEEVKSDDSDGESENWGASVGGLQRGVLQNAPGRQASVGDREALLPGRGSTQHDGAVFRLRQFGARRRKLLQQIGVKDPLLMSSATSLSTESAGSTSEEGDSPIGMSRVGLSRRV